MIRIRLERVSDVPSDIPLDGIVWYETGRPMCRVIIEELVKLPDEVGTYTKWVPVEMVGYP